MRLKKVTCQFFKNFALFKILSILKFNLMLVTAPTKYIVIFYQNDN